MKLGIVDASVAVKWFVIEENGRQESLKILSRIEKKPTEFALPELFFNEMLAVFCKLINDPIDIMRYMDILGNLGCRRIGNGRQLLNEAATLAKKTDLSGYDSIYLASAKLTSGTWLTADGKAHRKVKHLKLSSLIGSH